MTIHLLRPRQVACYPITHHQADPEIGGIEVIIWRDARRDDDFMFCARNWQHVHRLLTDIDAIMEGRK
ncbi:MAG: hypothetical protein ACU0DX_14075 [Roseovarius sp.]|uniref:hypothetical protein n=1 Tax=Roseovarius sp. TaxID=1486281 RepID=UPI0040583D0A